jgi:aspartate/methionine/tyrosine aminotransferase
LNLEQVQQRQMTSSRAESFTESVIRGMTRLALQYNAVNLAQGFPDFAAPEEIKRAAQDAIAADVNQYAITWGTPNLRNAIAGKYSKTLGRSLDPEREITVCCGSTEAMIATLLAVINPGDEVVVFEPFYENYGPDAILSGATPRFVKLRPPSWSFDPDELAAAFGPRTKAIILNTPNNPSGHVFTRPELEAIRDLCLRWNTLAITDEIYEHIIYDDAEHISIASLDGMAERTVTINGLSKTYSVTGWRVGWTIAPPHLTNAIRKVHDFLTVGAAAPLQEAGAMALQMPSTYYDELKAKYTARRNRLYDALQGAGLDVFKPQGAYYIMADIGTFGFESDVAFARHLVETVGVAPVPGSSFYNNPRDGAGLIRFVFCKKDQTLDEAARRLSTIRLKH